MTPPPSGPGAAGPDPDDLPAHPERLNSRDWQQLLERPRPSRRLVDFLLEQATGTHAAARPAWRFYALVESAVPLTEADLSRAVELGLPPAPGAACALLAHPAATIRTTTDLLDTVMDHRGLPRRDGMDWRDARALIRHLSFAMRPAVSLPARIRADGLLVWTEHPDDGSALTPPEHARAQRRYARDMAAIDAYGPAGWTVVEALHGHPDVHGPAYLTAVAGALSDPTRAR